MPIFDKTRNAAMLGKFVVTEQYGTHGGGDVAVDELSFDTEEKAQAHRRTFKGWEWLSVQEVGEKYPAFPLRPNV